jgi:hypothetical protein
MHEINAGRGVGAAGIARKWEGERRGAVGRTPIDGGMRHNPRQVFPDGPRPGGVVEMRFT